MRGKSSRMEAILKNQLRQVSLAVAGTMSLVKFSFLKSLMKKIPSHIKNEDVNPR
jgi:hypothetical protein